MSPKNPTPVSAFGLNTRPLSCSDFAVGMSDLRRHFSMLAGLVLGFGPCIGYMYV